MVPWVNRTILYRDGQRINDYQYVLTHTHSLGEEAGMAEVQQKIAASRAGQPARARVVRGGRMSRLTLRSGDGRA